jgi:hypothetical protein
MKACPGGPGANTGDYRLSSDLEQVHVIRMFCRGLRPVWVAAFVVSLAVIPALAVIPNSSQPQATQTTLLVNTHDLNGRTQATFFVAVTGSDGLPATGSIAIIDHDKQLAGFILDVQGQATATVELAPGDHDLSAVYMGDSAHLTSRSQLSPVHATASGTPGFDVSVSPATLSLVQGQSGSAVVSVTPVNAASLTGPMFVTISCSGLPDQSACTFTPENIEIPIGATAAINSTMVVATQSGTLTSGKLVHRDARPIASAMLPGALALVGLAFSVRRRRFLSRLVLLALLGLVTVLGATACSPLYNYHNHGPPHNLPTPAGNFKITIAAQSSNGVTATTETTTLALTVTQ